MSIAPLPRNLHLSGLCVRRGKRLTLDHANLAIGPGEFVGLIGANGAGKTTLMRAAMGLQPAQGRSNLAALPAARRALAAAWMPQGRDIAWPVRVDTLIRLGRIPHRRPDIDTPHVEAAMQRMDVGHLRDRPVTQLSGGELARVLIARALAQKTPILLADEPISGLDPAHQIATMQVFRALADEGHCVMASLHDLGLAVRHCTRLVMMQQGRITADGPPEQVLSSHNLAQGFGVSGYFAQTSDGPVFQPLHVLE